MLSKGEIAQELENRGCGKKRQMMSVLSALGEIAAEQVTAGEDFSLPGVARVSFGYTQPRKKGEEYVGFGGEIVKAEKARPEKVKIRATPAGALKKLLPNKGTKGYKNVVARKKR